MRTPNAGTTATLNLDLLNSTGGEVASCSATAVTLAANTWIQLTLRFTFTNTQVRSVVFAPTFGTATSGAKLCWDDVTLTQN